MKKIVYTFFLLLFSYLALELAAAVGLRYLRKKHHISYEPVDKLTNRHKHALGDFLSGNIHYIDFSKTLGWSIKPKGDKRFYHANAQGIRSNREYSPSPSNHITRIACFGDSFTHGDDVGNADTWPAQLENLSTDTDVLNFGVQGYGVDQAYLRYLNDGRPFHPHIVLIGFMSENIFRHVNLFRPFYYPKTKLPLFKPRAVIQNQKLVWHPNPMQDPNDYASFLENPRKKISENGPLDFFYQKKYKTGILDFSRFIRLAKITIQHVQEKNGYGILKNGIYNPDCEAFEITVKLLDAFHHDALQCGSTPIFLVFPRIEDLEQYRTDGHKIYQPLVAHLENSGHDYVDLMDAFQTATTGDMLEACFVKRGHYSSLGNKRVAEYIRTYLDKKHE